MNNKLADAKKVTMTEKQMQTYGFDNLNQGRKDDNGKLRYDLVPAGTWAKVVAVITFGAKKYDDNNWQIVVKEDPARYYAAMMRHIEAWWDGEKIDADSGVHHLANAICCALFLMWNDGDRDEK